MQYNIQFYHSIILYKFFSPNHLHECYNALVERLKAERKYEDAATILKDYLNDTEEAVAVLCEGRIWKRAIRIAHDIQRLDLLG